MEEKTKKKRKKHKQTSLVDYGFPDNIPTTLKLGPGGKEDEEKH